MTTVFTLPGTNVTFMEHIGPEFDHIYLIHQPLPHGLTDMPGVIAMSPYGTVLGWKFVVGGEWEQYLKDADIPITLRTKTLNNVYWEISGTTKTEIYNTQVWSLTPGVSTNNASWRDTVNTRFFQKFADAIASLERLKFPWDDKVVKVVHRDTVEVGLIQQWDAWMQVADLAIDTELAGGGTPQAWIDAGLSPDEYVRWYAAGGFDPEVCAQMKKAGIEPEAAGDRTSEGGGGYEHTIAYKVCNGDLDLAEAQELIITLL